MPVNSKLNVKKVSFAPNVVEHKYEEHNHITKDLNRNDNCSCGSGKKLKKCCAKETEVIVQELDKMEINSELYASIDQDMRSKYIKQFGEIKQGGPIQITREDNIKRHAHVIAFWFREASIKDYHYKEKDLQKFAMCCTNASNLIERSYNMGFLSEVIDTLQGIYEGFLYLNKKTVQLLQDNEFDVDFNIPSLIVEDHKDAS